MYYNKYIWHDGDIISAAKLNHIETGIKDISDLIDGAYNNNTWEKSDVVSVDRLNNIEDGIEDLVDIINKKDIMPLSVVPSEQEQIFNDSSIDGYKPVTVSAISSTYIGSGITQRDSSSLSASGDTILVPSGYYGSNASKSVASGTAGIPIATKGTVSNHSISVTPSVTNTTGYITGSTKTGMAVSVSASELVSGSETKTENGTYDVTNLASLIVAVQKGTDIPIFSVDARQSTPTVTCNKTFLECYNLYNSNSTAVAIAEVTTQSATLKMAMSVLAVYAGAYIHYAIYNELGEPVADILYYANDTGTYTTPTALLGDAGTPTATKGTVSNHSISVTPSVTNTTGYITGSTKTGTAVIVRASELVSGTLYCDDSGIWDVTNAKYFDVGSGTVNNPTATKGTVSNHSVTVTPSVTSSDGWISGGTKTGTAISVSASELVSGNKSITSNGTNIDVTNYETVSVNVEGGGTPGDNLEYGLTDGTLAIIGVGKIGQMEIE